MLSDKLISTDYHAVFGSIGEDGTFAPKGEGEGKFLLMDEAGKVLPHGYDEDIERTLKEWADAIIAYAKG